MTSNFAPRRRPLTAALAAALALSALVACSSTTSGGGNEREEVSADDMITAESVDADQLDAAIKRALLDAVPAEDLDPVVTNALAVASEPLSDEQKDLLKECLNASSCETGRGSLTVGISVYPTGNSARSIWRAETTAQAIAYPQVKKIVYVGSGADISEVQANLRSLIAQNVDVIVDDPVFGAAVLPVVQQAQKAGITYVTGNSNLPKEAESLVAAQVPFNPCAGAEAAAENLLADAGSDTPQTYGMYTGVPGNAPAANWQPCLTDAMENAGWRREIEGFTQWTPQGEVQEANALISAGEELGGIFYDYTNDEFLKAYVRAGEAPPDNYANTPNYSFFGIQKSVEDAGFDTTSYVANGHAWFGRMALTAAMMIEAGMDVPAVVDVPVPVVSINDIQDQNIDGMPASAPLPTLLDPEMARLAISAS
jgi:ABC-type sugar transport system substrate-binding protein